MYPNFDPDFLTASKNSTAPNTNLNSGSKLTAGGRKLPPPYRCPVANYGWREADEGQVGKDIYHLKVVNLLGPHMVLVPKPALESSAHGARLFIFAIINTTQLHQIVTT